MAIKGNILDDFFEEKQESLPKKKKEYGRYKIYEDTQKKTLRGSKSSEEQGWEKGNTTHNKRVTQPITKGKQKGNKRETENEQKDNKRVTQPITQRVTNDSISLSLSVDSNSIVSTLMGLQRKIIFAIYNICKLHGGNITPATTLEHLATTIGTKKTIAKTTINRLKKKNYIAVDSFQAGRAGWIKYKLPQHIYLDLLRYEGLYLPSLNATENQEKDNKRVTQPITQTVTAPLNSSSNYNNNNTITKKELPEVWLDIDFEPLRHIGFSSTQVRQLYEKELNIPETVQISIYRFAFGLENNGNANKYKDKNPLNVLMGVLRQGREWTEEKYESPKDRALRELAERQKKQDAERKKHLAEIREIEFKKWIDSMTNEELAKIEPKAIKEGRDRLSGMSLGALYPVFEEAVWSKKRKEISELLGEET